MYKAFIVSVENNGYQYKVRIPVYHKIKNTQGAVSDENLPLATVCTLPSISPYYQVGDVVWVGFENNEVDNPVILGLLFRKEKTSAISEIEL